MENNLLLSGITYLPLPKQACIQLEIGPLPCKTVAKLFPLPNVS